jgi:hypothetical protein
MKRLGLGLLVLMGGCSSFGRDWDAALPTAGSSASGSGLPTGCWEGFWHSDASGHQGSLRCIITRRDNSEFDARYYASYSWWIIPFTFEYTVPLTIVRDGDAWHSRGSAELSCWVAGGLYEYEGRSAGDEFIASYRSDFDHGVFRLKRVK